MRRGVTQYTGALGIRSLRQAIARYYHTVYGLDIAPERIIVTAGAPDVPKSLVGQLKDGGRLVIPVGRQFSQVLKIIEKTKSGTREQEICGCVFVPLVGKEGWSNP